MPSPTPLALAFATLLATSALAAETEWPQFRGPTGQGHSQASDLPVQWSATSGVAWKQDLAGTGWSSPVLSADRLYLTSAIGTGGDVTLHALCLDAKTGATLWDSEVLKPDPADVAAMHRKNSPASATPILRDGRLYVHFGHMGTAALDLEGKVLWRQTELKYPPTHGNGGSPELVGQLLVFSCDGGPDPFVAAIDAATGAIKWKTPRNTTAKRHFSFSTPLAIEVGGQTQIISPASGFVAAYDPANGSELWRVRYGEGYSVVPRPVFAHGLLFLSSGFDRPEFYAIDPKGAKGDATETNVVWKLTKGAPLTPSPLVVGNEVYLCADKGIATCVDAKTGQVHWSERLGGDFSASPIHADGRLYFQNETGTGYVVKAGTTYQLLAKNDLGERTLASYAATDGALFIRSEGHLWRIGAK
jgi:outer membrane protein assembly factor BamB